jgi:hypothetical protein
MLLLIPAGTAEARQRHEKAAIGLYMIVIVCLDKPQYITPLRTVTDHIRNVAALS